MFPLFKKGSGIRLSTTFVSLLMVGILSFASTSNSEAKMEIGFFFWHRKGSDLNISEYNPKFPQRYEYLTLNEWSPNGWKPSKVDIALEYDAAGQMRLNQVSSFQVSLALRVGPLRGDPVTKVTDFEGLEKNAIWLPSFLAKKIPRGDLSITNRIVLVKDYNLEQLTTDLWKRNLWPLELRVKVLLEPIKPDQLKESVFSGTLRIIPGD